MESELSKAWAVEILSFAVDDADVAVLCACGKRDVKSLTRLSNSRNEAKKF